MADVDPRVIREATQEDAIDLCEIYQAGTAGEFRSRLADKDTAPGTTHYVVESATGVVAAFAVTAVGRLQPGGAPRVLLHDVRMRPSARGTSVPEHIFLWLRDAQSVGDTVELLALVPLDQPTAVLADFGLSESHRAFRRLPGTVVAP